MITFCSEGSKNLQTFNNLGRIINFSLISKALKTAADFAPDTKRVAEAVGTLPMMLP